MGYGVGHRTYHTSVVRGPITQSINAWTPLLYNEAGLALDDLIRCEGGMALEEVRLYGSFTEYLNR